MMIFTCGKGNPGFWGIFKALDPPGPSCDDHVVGVVVGDGGYDYVIVGEDYCKESVYLFHGIL